MLGLMFSLCAVWLIVDSMLCLMNLVVCFDLGVWVKLICLFIKVVVYCFIGCLLFSLLASGCLWLFSGLI